MFQFQGGIEDRQIDKIVSRWEKEGFLSINGIKGIYA